MYYKCFNKDLTNRYGKKFEENKLYHIVGKISFGNDGNGFHVCKNLEDTLRYFDALNTEVVIARVNCFGAHFKMDDEYNGFYDMYAFEYLYIEKFLKREEIINYMLNKSTFRVSRFISLFKLTKEELKLFKTQFKNDKYVTDYIKYYQENNTLAFKKTILTK